MGEEGEEGEVGKSEDSNGTGQSRARVTSLRDSGGPGMMGPWKEELAAPPRPGTATHSRCSGSSP